MYFFGYLLGASCLRARISKQGYQHNAGLTAAEASTCISRAWRIQAIEVQKNERSPHETRYEGKQQMYFQTYGKQSLVQLAPCHRNMARLRVADAGYMGIH
jgi:hypothetical protein